MMYLHSEMSPICGNNCKVPTKTEGADCFSDKASSSRQAQKAGRGKYLKKRRPTKVLYPARVRKYLPRQETDKAKKWLLILGAIVFFQIFLEDGGQCEHDAHKTLVAHDSNAMKFLDHANTTMDSRPLLAGHVSVHAAENETLGNPTILHFINGSQGTLDLILLRSTYYDLSNDSV